MLSDNIAKIIATEFNVPKEVVNHIYTVYWKEAREHIATIDFFNLLEGRKDILANIKVPGLGTLLVHEKALKYLNERHKNKED